jgi:hypothetical protein
MKLLCLLLAEKRWPFAGSKEGALRWHIHEICLALMFPP